MRHLFIVRHGNYDLITRRLNDKGEEQIRNLGNKINEILDGESAYIMTSTAPRALDSARLLKEYVNLNGYEELPYLWSGNDAPEGKYDDKPENITEMIIERSNKAKGLILVSHLEIVEQLPNYLIEYEFMFDGYVPEMRKGKAIHFDLDKRKYEIIPK